jgi:hypothetical protein
MGRATKVSDTFAAAYPNVVRWVGDEGGWIELGPDEFSNSFIRALNGGGMVWEGEDEYPTVDAAFADADAGIAEWLEEYVKPTPRKAKAAKKPAAGAKKKAALKMVEVESSMLSAIGYDDASKELVAVYNSGAVWRYRGVPKKVYKQLLASDSKGGHMRDLVIGQYPEYRVSR